MCCVSTMRTYNRRKKATPESYMYIGLHGAPCTIVPSALPCTWNFRLMCVTETDAVWRKYPPLYVTQPQLSHQLALGTFMGMDACAAAKTNTHTGMHAVILPLGCKKLSCSEARALQKMSTSLLEQAITICCWLNMGLCGEFSQFGPTAQQSASRSNVSVDSQKFEFGLCH